MIKIWLARISLYRISNLNNRLNKIQRINFQFKKKNCKKKLLKLRIQFQVNNNNDEKKIKEKKKAKKIKL